MFISFKSLHVTVLFFFFISNLARVGGQVYFSSGLFSAMAENKDPDFTSQFIDL